MSYTVISKYIPPARAKVSAAYYRIHIRDFEKLRILSNNPKYRKPLYKRIAVLVGWLFFENMNTPGHMLSVHIIDFLETHPEKVTLFESAFQLGGIDAVLETVNEVF